VPVYGTVDLNVGTGIVGGVVRGTRETGARVAEIALQILKGTPAQRHSGRGRTARADLRLAADQALGHRSVPAAIRFANPILDADCVGNLSAVHHRHRSSSSPRSCWRSPGCSSSARRRRPKRCSGPKATIRTSYERIRQLAGRLINAQEAARAEHRPRSPRRRVPGTGGRFHRRGQSQEFIRPDSGRADAAGAVEDSSRDARHVRRDPPSLARTASGDLAAGRSGDRLAAHCTEVEKRHAVAVSFTADGEFADLDPDVAVCFFRIAQESLRNGVVHGGRTALGLARAIRRARRPDGDRRRQRIRSRGGAPHGGGLGLVSIEERAHAIGGRRADHHRAPAGDHVHVRAPAGVRRGRAMNRGGC
jgi:hypothetical protein